MKRTMMGAATAALLAIGAQSAFAENVKVSIGYPPAVDFLPAFVANDTGCFKDNGIDAELLRIAVATNISAGLASGTLQIGMSTATILLPAVENGLDIVAIAGSSRLKKGNENISMVVKDGVEIKSAKDVIGKKIGVPGILSVGDLVFRKWLKNNGIDLAQVTFIETPFPRMKDMLKAGTVDAVLAAEPVRTFITIDKTGYRAPEEYYSAVSPDSALTFWTAMGPWAKANPQVIKAFKSCLAKSIDWIKANPEKALEIEEKYLRFKVKGDSNWTSEISAQDLELYAKISKELGLVKTDIDTKKIVFTP